MKLALFLVVLALTIASVVAGAVMQTFASFGEQGWPWWLPAVLIVLGVVGMVSACILGVNIMRREYELMTPEEREPGHRVARRVGREILEDYVEDREPNVGRAIARGIADELP